MKDDVTVRFWARCYLCERQVAIRKHIADCEAGIVQPRLAERAKREGLDLAAAAELWRSQLDSDHAHNWNWSYAFYLKGLKIRQSSGFPSHERAMQSADRHLPRYIAAAS